MSSTRPQSRAELDGRIERQFGFERGYASVSAVIAAAVVARLLPSGAVKGGSALRLRYGEMGTRFTSDVDVARVGTEGEFREAFAISLRNGWEGFTGTLQTLPEYIPDDLQRRYAMMPYLVHLAYLNQSWTDVLVEVSHNELGDADSPDLVASPDVDMLFEAVGLPSPGRLPLMPLRFQIAQKLHALSDRNSERPHDLVDLQVIFSHDQVDESELGELCPRLFAYRKSQQWPPSIVGGPLWNEGYAAAAYGLDVHSTVDEAISWANQLVDRLSESRQAPPTDTLDK